MAISVLRSVILPLDEALDASKTGGEKSSARVRRRTSRKSESKRTSVNMKDSLDMVTVVRDSWSPGNHVFPSRPKSPPLAHTNLDPVELRDCGNVSTSHNRKTDNAPQDNGSARTRRSLSRRQKIPSRRFLSPLPPLQTSLEDSTIRVASLLRKKLELDDSHGASPVGNDGYRNQCAHAGRKLLFPDVDGETGVATQSGGVGMKEVSAFIPIGKGKGRPLPPNTTKEKVLEPGEDNPHDQIAGLTDTAPPVVADVFTTPCMDILGIIIHGTDELQASIYLTHPSIRVSIVDTCRNGSLLKKSVPEKCVTSYYERGNPSVDYIMPILTKPYECRHHRAVTGVLKAEWKEMLTFNEVITHFTENENVIIFFELVDFVSMGINSRRCTNALLEHRPWHRIAWAFLRPMGKSCRSNLGQKIRLQLYKYKRKKILQTTTESCEVYALWSSFYRSTYPSTLYVTLRAISTSWLLKLREETTQPTIRSMFPMQEERGNLTFEQMVQQLAAKSAPSLTLYPTAALISANLRLPGHPCKIPTSILSTFYPAPSGCSSLAFSHSGHLLAAACAGRIDFYPLVLYKVPSFELVMVLEGHRGIIYSLCWDQSNSLLASASADRIVKVWCMDVALSEPWVTLPHPCYVYCVCFMTDSQEEQGSILATGAYDGYIRIWSIAKSSSQILAEFQGNSGRINCLLWCTKNSALYAGDSNGVLRLWKKSNGAWKLKKKLDLINGQALVSLCLHPNGRRMLMHTFKQGLFMVDLRIDCVSCEYVGGMRAGLERCAALLSPCGTLVFAGITNGAVHVWSTDTGKQLHTYSELPFSSAVGAIAYHPSEHLLALSAFGICQPIVLLRHIAPSITAAHPPANTVGTSILEANAGIESSNSDPAVSKAQLSVSQKWKDLAKTIERISDSSAASRLIKS